MGVFDSINETSKKALDSGQVYVDVSQKYFKLKAFQQLAKAFSFLSELACLLISISLLILTTIAYSTRKYIDKILIKKLSQDFFD